MATVKDCYTCVSYYEKLYKEKYGTPKRVNKYAARWGFDAILQDLTVDEAKGLLDYYFLTNSARRHDLEWFFYNYDKLDSAKDTHDKEAERQARIRQESKIRAEKWKEHGNKRTIGD
jgi:hypothetical protein